MQRAQVVSGIFSVDPGTCLLSICPVLCKFWDLNSSPHFDSEAIYPLSPLPRPSRELKGISEKNKQNTKHKHDGMESLQPTRWTSLTVAMPEIYWHKRNVDRHTQLELAHTLWICINFVPGISLHAPGTAFLSKFHSGLSFTHG